MPERTPQASSTSPATPLPLWRRREVRFVVLFATLLLAGFTFLSLEPVNDSVVEPFTGWVAKASAVALDLLGQGVAREGTVIRSERFAVNIENGCNGVETMLIFLAAVVAFPARPKAKLLGLVAGIAVIQLVNLVRVVALFLTGAYLPELFDASHTVVWQSLVILCGVLLWIFWAARFAGVPGPAATEEPSPG